MSLWRGLARASGAQIGRIAVKTYVCRGCAKPYPAKPTAPCDFCGRMDFAAFDSKAEARRWGQLTTLENAGRIVNLRRQVSYDLKAPNLDTGLIGNVARYVADFVYEENGDLIIEDVKGGITDVASLKLRWMAVQGLPVRLITMTR